MSDSRRRFSKARATNFARLRYRPATADGAVRRRSLPYPVPRGIAVREQVHTFIKGISTTTALTGNGALAIEPTLAMLQGSTDITNLFDQYRFTNIKMTIIPHQNAAEGLAAPTATIGYMFAVVDQDGAGPTTDAQFKERPDLVIKRTDQVIVINCKSPRISAAAYAGGAFTGYTVGTANVWLDVASTSIPYYGIYLLFQTALAGMTYDIITQVTMQAKHSR